MLPSQSFSRVTFLQWETYHSELRKWLYIPILLWPMTNRSSSDGNGAPRGQSSKGNDTPCPGRGHSAHSGTLTVGRKNSVHGKQFLIGLDIDYGTIMALLYYQFGNFVSFLNGFC